MPHCAIMMYPGRDDETKKKLAEKVRQLIMDELSLPATAVRVSIHDVDKESFADVVTAKIPEKDFYIK